jgi:hypothetical protein
VEETVNLKQYGQKSLVSNCAYLRRAVKVVHYCSAKNLKLEWVLAAHICSRKPIMKNRTHGEAKKICKIRRMGTDGVDDQISCKRCLGLCRGAESRSGG